MPDSVPLQTRQAYDLAGGMVTNYNFSKVQNNQCQLILNSDLTVDGSITRRKGRVKLNTSAIPLQQTVTHLYALGQLTGADKILAASGVGIYDVTSGIVPALIHTVPTAAGFSATTLENFAFYCNGLNPGFMTQGSVGTTYQTGISPVDPTQFSGFNPVVSPGAAVPPPDDNATPGTHRITFRYRSTLTGARSNPYIIGTDIASQTITVPIPLPNSFYTINVLAAMVSSDPQVNFIDYFIQESGAIGANAPYYYLGSSPNVIGTYNFHNNISDNELIVQETLDIDDDLPPVSMRIIETWRGRLLGIVDDYNIAFSKQRTDANSIINLPTSWPADNLVEVGYGDGDPLQKIIIFNDYVLAFKRRSVWIMTGDFDSQSFGFKRLKTNYASVGLLNPKCVVQNAERVFFITDDLKFYWFSITDFSTEQLRLAPAPQSDPVADVFTSFASNYRNEVNLVNYNFSQHTQIWCSFSNASSGVSSSQNFNTFVFDWTANGGNGAWHIHTGLDVASSVLARDSNRDYYVFTGDYYGYVWKHNFTDGDGAQINGTSTGSNYNRYGVTISTGGPFVVGEIIHGVSSGASGTIILVGAGFIRVNAVTGPFVIGETITGSVSLTTAVLNTSVGVLNDTSGFVSFTSILDGVYVTIVDGPGIDQIRKITSIPSTTQIVVTPGWSSIPNNLSEYTIGGIDWLVWSRNDWCDDNVPLSFDKLSWYLDLDIELDTSVLINPLAMLEISFYKDRNATPYPGTIRGIDNIGSFWGVGIWGISLWGFTSKNYGQVGLNLYFKQIAHKIRNRYAGFYYRLNGWIYTFQTVDQYRRQ